MLLCCVHPRPGHSQPEKADVARSRNPNPVPGQSRPGSGEGTANYGLGVQLPGRGQPGGNPGAASAWSVRGAEPTAE